MNILDKRYSKRKEFEVENLKKSYPLETTSVWNY